MEEYRVVTDCQNIDFTQVGAVIRQAGLTVRPIELVQKAFEHSYVTTFLFDGDKLIGTGRAVSDGAYEAGLYDIAVLPEYQGRGLGRLLLKEILSRLEGINVILYARPGVEDFYRKMGFSKLLTGMIRFTNAETMRSKGFID